MVFQGLEQPLDAIEEAIVDDALIFQSRDLVATMVAFLMDLILLRTDEGALVDVWVDFDIRVVAQLEGILGSSALCGEG